MFHSFLVASLCIEIEVSLHLDKKKIPTQTQHTIMHQCESMDYEVKSIKFRKEHIKSYKKSEKKDDE